MKNDNDIGFAHINTIINNNNNIKIYIIHYPQHNKPGSRGTENFNNIKNVIFFF